MRRVIMAGLRQKYIATNAKNIVTYICIQYIMCFYILFMNLCTILPMYLLFCNYNIYSFIILWCLINIFNNLLFHHYFIFKYLNVHNETIVMISIEINVVITCLILFLIVYYLNFNLQFSFLKLSYVIWFTSVSYSAVRVCKCVFCVFFKNITHFSSGLSREFFIIISVESGILPLSLLTSYTWQL